MIRKQVYLGDDELKLLERASHETGASRSELIRHAVRMTFVKQEDKAGRLRALEASAGSWRNRRTSGAGYVDDVRGAIDPPGPISTPRPR